MISKELQDKLIALSKQAEKNAHNPYSKFSVGAALITEDGDVFTGCNVENVSFGLTNCGERTAVFKMVSEKGSKVKIKAIAVTGKKDIPLTPCGACRQVISEFSTTDTLIIYKGQQDYEVKTIGQMLPGAFSEFVSVDEGDLSKFIHEAK